MKTRGASTQHWGKLLCFMILTSCNGDAVERTTIDNTSTGIKMVKVVIHVGQHPRTLTLCLFDEQTCTIRVAAQKSKQEAIYLANALERERGLAGCNGGYFHPRQLTTSGLEIADGKKSGIFGPSGSGDGGGVLHVRSGKPGITPQNEFKLDDKVTQLVQCGPMLVKNGVHYHDAGENMGNAHTFVGTDGTGHWMIGICDNATLSEVADWLTNSKVLPEFRITTALSLDGGPSTGIAWKTKANTIDGQREKWPVRNFVLVVPK